MSEPATLPAPVDDEEFVLPAWFLDDDADIPVGFLPAEGVNPPRFTLGLIPLRAVVMLDEGFRELPIPTLLNLAGGAYQAVTRTPCDRPTAEAIARGWINCWQRLSH